MRNLKISMFALLLGALIVQSCTSKKQEASNGEKENTVENMDHQQVNEVKAESESNASTIKAATVSKEQLEAMLSGYFNIKEALVSSDAEEAKSAAEKLLANIGEEMTGLAKVVKSMASKEDVEMIRKDFDQLSESLYALLKANSDKKEATLYKQYCPMAFNNEGAYWLSKETEIKNPYFGDKMLKCGKVQEEL